MRSYYNSALQFLIKNCQARVEGGAERLLASNALTTPARGGADKATGDQKNIIYWKITWIYSEVGIKLRASITATSYDTTNVYEPVALPA